ncbi:DNA-binding response regulator, OmpR family, contains REC and winged-helix (wHTH) domain [Tissierella praeacuta DSM 18095]|uniref:DNA-binding response regulator, OmpR family, contains REC and winged-helix (WHTH) domain n=1 Tax=Tissierella praeacuta DSM 18095 TaxID=1123404 RepID=A0A1M4TUZ0_9FIRM|nr:response regulator transcription factor [Tissierella praeacuta]TCU77324.1 DNA-binding response OmpR family regulator [Tissierella praeacuta]SHE48253.1 DNA-binding response regulator, OmpR family, contains REC and winged-helix (wHTH) domain [Tissierella praeacuta DSM 18095]SUP04273.1 Sensory transduction protein regX3 [Tissierella praeacuta]
MIKILLVEDDRTLAMGIEYTLKNEGYAVDVADSFAKGKELVNKEDYDLIILDIELPDGNGFELCKHIRKDKATPIIFLTAQDEEVNVVMGLDIGGDDYITKPFRIKELISRIKAVLRRASNVLQRDILVSNDIKMNLTEHKVYIKDELVQLTPSEYKLLSILMNNSHQVLSRMLILEKLWDIEGEFVDDNSLSVYIRRLREKIEKDSSNPVYIKTVRGVGYIWDVDVRG